MRPAVVKYGGAVLEDPGLARAWTQDVAALARSGRPAVVVHGGGRALSRTLERMGIPFSFADGLRVTSHEAAEVAEMVLSGRMNKAIVAGLAGVGVRAVGLSGTDGRTLRIRPHRPGGLDLGAVGEVASVDTALLEHLLAGGFLPVLSTTAADDAGRPHNVNADTAAAAVAGALHAPILVLLTDVPGVLVGGEVAPGLTAAQARALLASGEASGGMRPKLEAALAALAAGVAGVRIADGRIPHALARAFTGASGGTLLEAA